MALAPRTLHFDLSWLSPDHEYTLLCGVPGGIPLRRYADEPAKLDEHRSTNAALGLVPESRVGQITHFVEEAPLSRTGVSMCRVVHPSLDDHPLPEIAMAFLHIGLDDVAGSMRRMPGYRSRQQHHLAFATYGVDREATAAQYRQLHLDASAIKPPGVTAQALVMQHPELGTVDGRVAHYVLDTYVTHGMAYQDLVAYIQQNGPGTPGQWYNKSWVMWSQNEDGTGPMVPMDANLDLEYKGGGKVTWPTPPDGSAPGLPTYTLTDQYDPPVKTGQGDGVVGAATTVVSQVLAATKNDDALNGILWSAQLGTTERATTAGPQPAPTPQPSSATQPAPAARPVVAARPAVAASGSASGFGVKNVTSSYGLWLYDERLAWEEKTKTLSFPVKNWPSRYLGLYVSFLRSDGTVIPQDKIVAANPVDPGKPYHWVDQVPISFVKPIVEPSDTKNYLSLVSSGSAIFGVPTPFLTQEVDVQFLWPDEATHAKVLLGGLGCASGFSDWDGDVDLVGVLGTGIVCYGVGVVTMLVGVYVVNPFISWLQEEWGAVGFFAVCGVIGAAGLVTGIGTYDTSTGKMILSKLASTAAGAAFGAIVPRLIKAGAQAAAKGLAKAAGELAAEITAEEALEQVPVAGWALKIASIAADLAALTATTVECVLSPATYELDVLRTMDLSVTVTPDPAHGKQGFNPVWPLVSDHYVIQATYPAAPGQAGGTTYTISGPMPAERDGAIAVTFPGLPAGGKIEVTAGIYSDTNWLCGRWNSGWISAVPEQGDAISTSGSITELLVPLTPSTRYSQKQTLSYAGGRHVWKVTRFALAESLTPDLDAGGTPSPALADAFAAQGNPLPDGSRITVVSPLSEWTVGEPRTGTAFAVRLVELLSAPAFTLPSSLGSVLDRGGATPQQVVDAFAAAQFPLPDGTSVTVVTKGTQWSVAVPGRPTLFTIGAAGADLQVDQVSSELQVQDSTHATPPLPDPFPLPSGPVGNALGALQNIVHNNTQYQLGYAWMASGQNLPLDGGSQPQNVPMYAMQSISTLGQPQDQIIEPTRGFGQETFLAYDQFGLTELFPLAASFAGQLNPGPVSSGVAEEFSAFGRPLPVGCTVGVVTAGSSWTIGPADGDPLYQLDLVRDPDGSTHLGVFAYPVPGLDNFYLDPRSKTDQNPVYYLRGVDLDRPPGASTFDYDQTTAWGRFTNTGTLQGLTVHPSGYVVGVDFENHKLYSLKLPATAQPSDEAPFAMPLSGEGVREGLMQTPQALTITADGRILILEEGNRRIQAFDVKGNPVACFSVGQPHFTLPSTFVAELDANEASTALVQAFQVATTPALAPKTGVTDPDAVVADLDAGRVDATLVEAFVDSGYAKTGDAFGCVTTTAGRLWLVTDTTSGAVFDLRLEEDEYGLPMLYAYAAATFVVTIRSRGLSWLLEDTTNATRYQVTLSAGGGDLAVQQVVSYLPLREQSSSGVTYLDLAAEGKGYIYVLFVTQTTGKPTFSLDIYNPDGTPLLTEPQRGVNAARLTVDQWRSMFTLDYDVVLGPNGRTEPGVSAWIPSTSG